MQTAVHLQKDFKALLDALRIKMLLNKYKMQIKRSEERASMASIRSLIKDSFSSGILLTVEKKEQKFEYFCNEYIYSISNKLGRVKVSKTP